MALTHTSKSDTICERVRNINDMHQGNTSHDKAVRMDLGRIEYMAKRMMRKLAEYKSDKELKEELFPMKTIDYLTKRKIRKRKGYKVD